MKYPTIYLAQASNSYNCGVYGAGTFNTNDCNATTSAGSSSGGLLADTGYEVLIPMALAVAIIVASLIYLVRQIRRRKG